MDPDELKAWLRLLLSPGLGRPAARQLLQALGSAQAVFEASAADWQALGLQRLLPLLAQAPPELDAQLALTLAWLQGPDRAVITLGDAAFPPALLQTEDPPLLLFAQGSLLRRWQAGAGHGDLCLAMVGSRNPTPQGERNAREFAQALAGLGVCVVSGLALGIDGAAHEGALDGAVPGQLATVAVVGTGLDRVYPARHQPLARRIAQQGLILSEYPLGTPPLNANFPRRNRIISGLGQGTLVIEAALESGSLITARQALEQGREVFAIPGSIHSPQSKGCHALIKQGAKLVESAQDVLEELRVPDPFAQVPLALDTPAAVDGGLLALLGHDPVGLDALHARSGLDTAHLQAELLDLELAGQVERLPGGLFQRVVRG